MANKQTKVAAAVAMQFVSNVGKAANKAAKKAGPVIEVLSQEERIARCVAAFADWQEAEATMQSAKMFWDMARMQLRDQLKDGRAQWTSPKEWGAFLKALNPALVAAQVVADVKAARKLVNNQLQALGLLGGTERAGAGRKPGAGRKEKVSFTATKGKDTDDKRVALIAAYCKAVQKRKDVDAIDPLEMAADILRICHTGK